MFCRYCGKQIDDSALVCPECGIPVKQEGNTEPAAQPVQQAPVPPVQNMPPMQNMQQMQPPFMPYPPPYPVYAVPILAPPKPPPPLAPPAVRRSMTLCWLAVLLALIGLFAGRLQYTLVADNRAYDMLDHEDPDVYHDEAFIKGYEGYSIWGPGAEWLFNGRDDHTDFFETVRFIERENDGIRSNHILFGIGLILYIIALVYTVVFAIVILILWIFSHVNRNARDYRAAWKNLRTSVTLLLTAKITAVISMVFVKIAVHDAAKLLAENDYTKKVYTFYRIAPQALITIVLLVLLRIYISRQLRKRKRTKRVQHRESAERNAS
ncbi:MAG: zinc ribbon domain-containing protein [Oscillospiraceae bacterium]|nr:zinc ribbon domain-containing protein [Oscillospiraceae bacterium]